MRTLIVYYSLTKNNETLAWELQQKLNCDIQRIEEIRKRTNLTIILDLLFKRKPEIKRSKNPISLYDKIILIAPIWDTNVATPMKSFIEMERNNFKEYSFITVCSGRPGQLEKITHDLEELAGKVPLTVEELKVNDLLPFEQKNKVKYSSTYRIKKPDLEVFQTEIENFVHETQ